MTKRFLSLFPVAAMLGVLAATPAPTDAAELRADIPFSFSVNGKTLPPGTYSLSEKNAVLFVDGATGAAMTIAVRVQSVDHVRPSLVFHRYGDQYFLRQAWTGGRTGRELPERGIERILARAGRGPRTAVRFERVVVGAL